MTDYVQELASKFPKMEDIPAQFRLEPHPLDCMYLIDGKVQKWDGACTDIQSPICVQTPEGPKRPIIGQVPAMDEYAALEALNSAVRAWSNGRGVWPTMTVADRIGCMEKFVARMALVREEVVRLLMWEIGKNLPDSQKEFDRTVEYIRLTIDALKKMDRSSSQFQLDGGVIALVRRSPLGVCLSMGPFNYPLNETYTTLIPALIMGNTIVAKPPKFGGLAHQPLLQAFADCFPPGVVNVIYGVGASIIGPIIKTGKVDVLAFIGTSRAADTLKLQHPRPHRMRSILGLDAKNPAVVLPDADLDVAVKECIAGTLSFNGQRCTAIKLIFVHKDIAEPFVARFAEAVGKLKLGMPWEAGVGITPLPEFNKASTLRGMIDDAVKKGARLINPEGGAACETLVAPAVLFPVSSEARVFTEEQFGPVVPITTYSSTEEVLEFVAKSQYGQQVSLFGRDPVAVSKLVDELANQVCRINLNAQCQRGPDTLPFTGRKDSAEGTLSIHDALRCFSIRSLVATPSTPSNRDVVQDIVRGHYSKFLNTDFIL